LRSEGRAHLGHDTAKTPQSQRAGWVEVPLTRGIGVCDLGERARAGNHIGLPLHRGWGVCRKRCENCENLSKYACQIMRSLVS